jgi:hypothetical protein
MPFSQLSPQYGVYQDGTQEITLGSLRHRADWAAGVLFDTVRWYFNAIATHTASELPWKNIQKLAAEFMDVVDYVRRAGERASNS